MNKNKKIPCRVCGNPFEPCSTCRSHSGMFQWRSFACSKECAGKYISETISKREREKSHDRD